MLYLAITTLVFLLPALFLEEFAKRQGIYYTCMFVCELGSIVSLFLGFKIKMATFIPLTFFFSLASFLSINQFSDMEGTSRLILISTVFLVLNILLMTVTCCFVRRNNPKITSFKRCLADGQYFEFRPGRSFKEFLTSSKSVASLKLEAQLLQEHV